MYTKYLQAEKSNYLSATLSGTPFSCQMCCSGAVISMLRTRDRSTGGCDGERRQTGKPTAVSDTAEPTAETFWLDRLPVPLSFQVIVYEIIN